MYYVLESSHLFFESQTKKIFLFEKIVMKDNNIQDDVTSNYFNNVLNTRRKPEKQQFCEI